MTPEPQDEPGCIGTLLAAIAYGLAVLLCIWLIFELWGCGMTMWLGTPPAFVPITIAVTVTPTKAMTAKPVIIVATPAPRRKNSRNHGPPESTPSATPSLTASRTVEPTRTRTIRIIQ